MAAQCTRRAAKSYSCGIHFFEDSKKFPNSNYIYFTLTRETARKIFWKDVLKDIDRRFKVGCTFNESRLQCTTPWGAQITLIGVDADEKDKEKVLGQKIRWAYGDESAFFNINLEELVYDMLLPATADLNGGVTLISTTSNRTKSFFHDITESKIKGWEIHKWDYRANPYTRDSVQKLIDKLKNDREGIELTSGFRQMYLNEWVIDLSALVYKFDRAKNLCVQIPNVGYGAHLRYVVGVDLGFDDASAFTVCAWNDRDKVLYVTESFGKSGLDISAVAEEVKRLLRRLGGCPVIVDGANKQAVQEIIRRHNLPLIGAEKTKKFDHIQILNSDLITGNIKLVHDGCTELIEELETLVWDERKFPKKVELSSSDNHRCFVAGTKISTEFGHKNIEKIKVGELVKTRMGLKRVVNFGLDEKQVCDIFFSDRTKITCTNDHPFFTINNGFIAANNLTKGDLCLKEKSKFLMALSFIVIQILKTLLTVITLKKQFQVSQTLCTGMFGKHIMEKLKKVFLSTIKMETHQTILLKTLSALKQGSIYQDTLDMKQELNNQSKHSRKQYSKLRCGTVVKQGESTIGIMLENFSGKALKTEKRISKKLARYAASVTTLIDLQETLKKIAALESVFQKTEESQGSMTRKELVSFVVENLRLINTLSKYVVVKYVHKENDDQKRSEIVYNITVEEEHEYFANGILVSNCDSLLYAWRYCYNYLYKPEKELPKNGKEEVDKFWKEEQAKLKRQQRIDSSQGNF
jgi:hypothetical protein